MEKNKEKDGVSELNFYPPLEVLDDVEVAEDFLPPPKDLVDRQENVKITITLSKSSIEFFKDEARKHQTQYQKMIRRLLDLYASHHQGIGMSDN